MDRIPLNIILVDDDESDRINFKEALEESKIKTIIHMFNDGVDLMDYLALDSTTMPYILFLDMNMPRKNGLECLKEIRSNIRWRNVAIAIYSTSSTATDIDATFQLGANVYIKKPTDFNVLKQVLDRVLMAAFMYKEPPFNMANFIFKV